MKDITSKSLPKTTNSCRYAWQGNFAMFASSISHIGVGLLKPLDNKIKGQHKRLFIKQIFIKKMYVS